MTTLRCFSRATLRETGSKDDIFLEFLAKFLLEASISLVLKKKKSKIASICLPETFLILESTVYIHLRIYFIHTTALILLLSKGWVMRFKIKIYFSERPRKNEALNKVQSCYKCGTFPILLCNMLTDFFYYLWITLEESSECFIPALGIQAMWSELESEWGELCRCQMRTSEKKKRNSTILSILIFIYLEILSLTGSR